MTFQQLRCFTAVARLENVSQAAELLHISQSSLSKNISKLEAELGAELFDRQGRKVSLNAAGLRLLEYSTRTLRDLEQAREDLRCIVTGTQTRVRIATAWEDASLARCIAAFRRLHPETTVEIDSGIEQSERTDINDYDMLIYPAAQKYQKFTGLPLCRETYCLVVPEQHPLAGAASVRPAELNGLSAVILRRGNAQPEYPYQICSALAIRFADCCYVDSRELHSQFIASGCFVGFIPSGLSEFYDKLENVRRLPILDRRFSREMMVCFRREKHLTPLAAVFRDFFLDYYKLSPENVAEAQTREGEGSSPC